MPLPFILRYRRFVAIPEAVRTTVLGRIRRLGRLERAVLMRASVIGRTFDLPVLVATASCSQEQVRAAIERACELDLLVREDFPSERYAFRHALTRDIIYAEFLVVRVKPLHRKIARALERGIGGGGQKLEDLAYHSWAASDARRALRYNELAGDHAAAVHALTDARTYYNRARSVSEIGSDAYLRLSEKLAAIPEP